MVSLCAGICSPPIDRGARGEVDADPRATSPVPSKARSYPHHTARWPASNRNGGRHQVEKGGRLQLEICTLRMRYATGILPYFKLPQKGPLFRSTVCEKRSSLRLTNRRPFSRIRLIAVRLPGHHARHGSGQRLRHGLVDCGKPISSRGVVSQDTIIRLVSCLHAETSCWSGAVDTEEMDAAAVWRARSRTSAVNASRAAAAGVSPAGCRVGPNRAAS
jgi:hypothetical protein